MNHPNLHPPPVSPLKIATLVDHKRDGRFVIAYCPICDHAEEAEDNGDGRERAQSASVARIEVHIYKRHRAKAIHIKLPGGRRR